MKYFLLLAALAIAEVTPLNLNIVSDQSSWSVPDVLFNFGTVTKSTVEKELNELRNNTQNNVNYYLYTPKNPKDPQRISRNSTDDLMSSHFDGSLPTRILIHGFQSSANDSVCTDVRDAYIETSSSNVICVDWSPIANKDYVTATSQTPIVGEDIARFIIFLTKSGGMSDDELIVMGHSLGAHVAGFTGKEYHKLSGKKLKTIVGCDPAQPLFSYFHPSKRLSKSDANFLMTIQTNRGKLGFKELIGQVSFIPNGGFSQPGCGLDITGSCSHLRSYKYFAESIRYNDFLTRNCITGFGGLLRFCHLLGRGVNMSLKDSYGLKGVFYVPVNSNSPYGTGQIRESQ